MFFEFVAIPKPRGLKGPKGLRESQLHFRGSQGVSEEVPVGIEGIAGV